MSTNALAPCILCGKLLENIEPECENQPYGGTAFRTRGHYGSTAFDPMDGSFLEVTFCDPCLRDAQQRGRVLWGRDQRMVLADLEQRQGGLPTVVGFEAVDRRLVTWNGDADADMEVDALYVDREEVGSTAPEFEHVHWNVTGTERIPDQG